MKTFYQVANFGLLLGGKWGVMGADRSGFRLADFRGKEMERTINLARRKFSSSKFLGN